MSTETPTLDESHNEKHADENAADSERVGVDVDGAAYGRVETFRAEEPADAGCCRSCGTPVAQEATRPSEVQRVFADQHGRVLAGPCCQEVNTFAKAIQGVAKTTEQARELSPVEAYEREVSQ